MQVLLTLSFSGYIFYSEQRNLFVCSHCGHYGKMTVEERIACTFDTDSFQERFREVEAEDPLQFLTGTLAAYSEKLAQTKEVTQRLSSKVVGRASLNGRPLVAILSDFSFMGGSFGAAEGEKMCLAFEYAVSNQLPVVHFEQSGGARMQEGLVALMQMAKVSATIARFGSAKPALPYIVICANPCMGGALASYGSLADIILAEPGAQLGLAGRSAGKVTQEEVKLREAQTAESKLSHGHIDRIVPRKDMKVTLNRLLSFF